MKKLLQFLFILILGVFCCACVNSYAVHELNEKAFKYIEDGDYNSAISRLSASVDLDGDVYDTRYNLANALLTVGRCEEGVPHAQFAVKLKPKEPIAYFNLGTIAFCAAENLLKDKNNDKNNKQKNLQTSPYEKLYKDRQLQEKYIQFLTVSNQAFENYLQLVPNSSDAESVSNFITKSNDMIQKAKEPPVVAPKYSYGYRRY